MNSDMGLRLYDVYVHKDSSDPWGLLRSQQVYVALVKEGWVMFGNVRTLSSGRKCLPRMAMRVDDFLSQYDFLRTGGRSK